MEDDKNLKTLTKINSHLKDINEHNKKKSSIEKKRNKKVDAATLKKKTKSGQESKRPDDKPDKEMGALRKTFTDSFGKMDDFTSPGNLMKMTGLLSNSPLLMMAGDQLDSMRKSYKENKKQQKNEEDARKDEQKNDFLNESINDEIINENKKQTDALQAIVGNTDDISVKDKEGSSTGILGKVAALIGGAFGLKGLKGILSFKGIGKMILGSFKNLGKLVFGVFKGIGGKGLFSGIFKKGAIKGIGKGLLKGLLRTFGAILTPLFMAFDFFSGWNDAKAITGREGMSAKFQAGFSSIISGFTLGIIKPEIISEKIDKAIEWIKGIFPTIKEKFMGFLMAPIDLFKGLFSSDNIVKTLSEYMSSITLGAVNPETFQGVFDHLQNKFYGLIMTPFNFIKTKLEGFFPGVVEKINDILSSIKERIFMFKDKMTDILSNPFKAIKNLFGSSDEKEVEKSIKPKFYKVPKNSQYENKQISAIKRDREQRKLKQKSVSGERTNIIQQNNSAQHIHVPNDMSVFSDDGSIYNPVPVF